MSEKALDPGRERYRRAASTATMNIVAQVIQLATGLISVPLALGYVGPERFGIWMTLSTALAFITFSDFGIGIGMQDSMSRHAGKGDYKGARNAFYSAFALVGVIVLVVMLMGYLIVPRLDLASLFSLRSVESRADIAPAAIATIAVIVLGLLGGLVQRAFNAVQEGFLVAALQVFARLLSLALLFAVVRLQLGLPALVFAVGGVASCVLLLMGVPLLLHRQKWLSLSRQTIFTAINRESAKGLLSVGVMGLGASVAIYFVNNSIPFLISSKYGAESVADFAVLMKLLAIPGMLLTYVLSPLWPAITEANQKGDLRWIRGAYRKCVTGCIAIAVVSSIAILLCAPFVIKYWTNSEKLVPTEQLIIASIVFMVLGFWNAVASTILNGLSQFKGQASYGLLFAIGAVIVAAIIPSSLSKEYIVWVINIGFALRCIFMQIEINARFAALSHKGAAYSKIDEPSIL
ncbi:O-antigen/teichoic acid export membrane protein [Variovorax boronicumulans]|uniref:lipopolysaccharide biosynthesis protein n=1 Tax=Variovorax boronicumulans TaxID=436515 RepID=UPI002783F1E7|nr:MATE family efflux transporter [Variovorax boronicumulans]MDQ0072562.1 O-antigen/teichoic acid export membrane protein [Variovorax boronicumulans]